MERGKLLIAKPRQFPFTLLAFRFCCQKCIFATCSKIRLGFHIFHLKWYDCTFCADVGTKEKLKLKVLSVIFVGTLSKFLMPFIKKKVFDSIEFQAARTLRQK